MICRSKACCKRPYLLNFLRPQIRRTKDDTSFQSQVLESNQFYFASDTTH